MKGGITLDKKRPVKTLQRIEDELRVSILDLIATMQIDKDYYRYLYFKPRREKYVIKSIDKNEEDKLALRCDHLEEIGMHDYLHPKVVNLYGFDIKKFSQFCVPKSFMNTSKQLELPRDVKIAITEYNEYWDYWSDPNVRQYEKERLESLVFYPYYDQENNSGRIVEVKDLEKILERVQKGEERQDGESRPVVVGGQLFINASAAIESSDKFEGYKNDKENIRDPRKDGDKLYDACESGGTFWGKSVEYADAPTIIGWINILKNN